MPRTVRGLPQTLEPGPSSRFQLCQGPSNDYPCACFARFRLSDGCPGSFQARSSDVEENCLTLQLSSAVVRLVLEEKLSAFSLRAVATFTLFDQVSRACPLFSPLREASGRQSEVCACSSIPFPAPSTEISCLQVSAKRSEPLKVSPPLTSGLSLFFLFSIATGEQQKGKVRDFRDGGERTTSKPMNLTHSRIPLNLP